jgi:hypothetical protein
MNQQEAPRAVTLSVLRAGTRRKIMSYEEVFTNFIASGGSTDTFMTKCKVHNRSSNLKRIVLATNLEELIIRDPDRQTIGRRTFSRRTSRRCGTWSSCFPAHLTVTIWTILCWASLT